jgi:N-acetylneuraminic acid mutarotase
MAHQVFLSHAKEDQAAASRVCETLEADGVHCWLAVRDLQEGSDPAASILGAIRDADLVLLLFSASANSSPAVLRDIERAIAYEKRVLSLHLDEATPNASLEYYLNLWQWLDVSGDLEARRDGVLAAVRGQLSATADSGAWRGVDAPDGVDSKREEILAAVRGHLAQTALLAASHGPGAEAAARPRRPSRRTLGIVVGACLVALALGLGLGLGLTGTSHQGAWARLNPAGPQPPIARVPIVYDSAIQRVVFVGGGLNEDSPDPFSDTEAWAYDPMSNTWAELEFSGTVAPPIIGALAMNCDPVTGRLIVFGGFDRAAQDTESGEWVPADAMADTWAFDPVAGTWTKLEPAGTVPPARVEGATAYDPTTRRLMLFGGVVPNVEFLNDMWAYDPAANTWKELKPSGTLPPGRSSKMVYDPSTGRMLMFGGSSEEEILNDIWAYDLTANTWTDLDPPGARPKPRVGYGMAYDASSHRVIVFGGYAFVSSRIFNDTWAYDPSTNTWTELNPSGVLPRPGACSLAYDPTTQRLIMYGSGENEEVMDTWAYTP